MTEPVKEVDQSAEKLPISEFYKVVDHSTIFKSSRWWEAVAVVESYGKRFVAMYMWQSVEGKWKRKHKFHIRSTDEWSKVKATVERLLPKISTHG